MTPVRLGAVGYLNARPLVYGLEQNPRFSLRYDLPSRCAELLHVLDPCVAALIIGDNALLLDGAAARDAEKIDLGEAWTVMTGLPFVYAFWAGPGAALTASDIGLLQQARDFGVARPDEIAR